MENKSITLLNNATEMLATVNTIDDAKNLMDKASAVKHYAQKHNLGKEAVSFAQEIERSSELLLGKFLKEMEKNKGAQGIGKSVVKQDDRTQTPTYEEMGITYNLGAEAQELTNLSDEDKEKFIKGKISKKKAKNKTKTKKKKEEINARGQAKSKLHPNEKELLPELILADPPWKYDFAETDNRKIENQYPTATVEEMRTHIKKTAPDCVLFMWATAPKLKEALVLIEEWGFTYKTHAIWDKVKIGMGYWFRGQHELLLFATKGNVSPPFDEQRVSSIFTEARKGHSVKPNCVYEWIEKTFPHLTKLEMYARKARVKWTVMGNEI